MQRSIFQVLGLLVHILALSDDDADHVELPVSAGLPDICKIMKKRVLTLKTILGLGILADVKRLLLLGVFHVTKLVIIGLPLK
jgi:hypothetical protein